MRYFDPDFMKTSAEPVLAGNLPDVFEPFNALDVDVENDLELNLDSIKEAQSQEEEDEIFTFRAKPVIAKVPTKNVYEAQQSRPSRAS